MKKQLFKGFIILTCISSPLWGDENTPILTKSLATQTKNALTNLQNFTQLNFMGQIGQVSSITLDASTALDKGEAKLSKALGGGPLAKETAHIGRQCISNMIGKLGLKFKLPNIGQVCGVDLTDFVYGYVLADLKKLFGLKSLSWNIDTLEYLKNKFKTKQLNSENIYRAMDNIDKATKDSNFRQHIIASCIEYNKLGKEDNGQKQQLNLIKSYKKEFGNKLNKQEFEAQCLMIDSPYSYELIKAYLKSLKGGNIFDLPNSANMLNKQKQITNKIKKELIKQSKFINTTKQHNKQDNNFLTQNVDTSVLVPLPIFKIIDSPENSSGKGKKNTCTTINEDSHQIMKKMFNNFNKNCSIPQLSIEMVSSSNINTKNQIVKNYNQGIETYLNLQKIVLGKNSSSYKQLEKSLKSLEINTKTNKDYRLNYPQILMLAQIFKNAANGSYLVDSPLAMQREIQNNQIVTNLQLFVLNNQVYNIQKHQREFELKNAITQQDNSNMILTELKKQNVILVNLLTKIVNK